MLEGAPVRVVVAIPTFRRPRSLERLLDALARMKTRAAVSVIIADNDAEAHEGFDLCRRLAPSYPWPLEAVIAPERGIAQARNALVEKALSDHGAQFIAMIDDDEWPEADWLDEFLCVQAETGVDALQGSILFARTEDWMTQTTGLADIRRPTGPAEMLQGAGNLFLTRAALEEMPCPWFDPAFALSGGEDRDFFVRLKARGKRFAWADGARAMGEIPATRQSLAWALRRAFSVGNSDMRVLIKHRAGPGLFVTEGTKIAGVLLLSPVMLVILAAIPNCRTRWLAKLFRAAGKLAAMLGAQYNEYSMIHGE